jgi:hypothetical protein
MVSDWAGQPDTTAIAPAKATAIAPLVSGWMVTEASLDGGKIIILCSFSFSLQVQFAGDPPPPGGRSSA